MDIRDFLLVQEIQSQASTRMPNTQELKELREELRKDIEDFTIKLVHSSKAEIEQGDPVRPLVVGVGGKGPKFNFMYPVVESEDEQDTALENINKELLLTEAQGAIARWDGVWTNTDGDTQEALMVAMHMYNWRQVVILPYSFSSDTAEVILDDPIDVTKDITKTMITAFEVD